MKKIRPYVKDFVKRADMVLLAMCIVCALFGIVVISSASSALDDGPVRYVLVQSISLIIGIVLFVLLTIIDLDVFAEKWMVLIVLEVAFMLLLLTPLGYADNTGNRAWLRFGPMGVQPTEVIKIAFIIR